MKAQVRDLHEIDCYIASDQPTVCPKCGARTEFVEVDEDKQQHECPRCQYEFFLDIEGEETMYENSYKCTECGCSWTDQWSCQCDDECPDCGTVMTPYFSEEIESPE